MENKSKLVCLTCGNSVPIRDHEPCNTLCNACGGSVITIESKSVKQFKLTCAKCKKSFFVESNTNFDIRKFEHCQLKLFTFQEALSTEVKEKYDHVKKEQAEVKKPASEILSLPFPPDKIKEAREKLGNRDKVKIGIIAGVEPNHLRSIHLEKAARILADKYQVIPIKSSNLTQDEWLYLNECDLVAGQFTFATKHALMLQVPTFIIHTEVNLAIRCQVSLYGIIKTKANTLINKIELILSKPSLTYCLVTHNRREITKQCVEAILEHKKANEEIVIVDNASTDGLLDWLKHISKDRKYINLIENKENIGCVKGRNQAMKAAKGREIFTLDSDQIISIDTLHKMHLIDADIVGSEAWDISRNGTAAKVSNNSNTFDYVGAGGMLLKKQTVQSLDFFDEQFSPAYYEDPDFCLRAKEMGFTIKVCDNNIKHLGPGMDQTLGDKAADVKVVSRDKFIKKWEAKFKRKRLNIKPRILFLVDVPGWAWDVKTKNIKRYIESDFEIVIKYQYQISDFLKADDEYDIYFAYDCPYVRKFKGKNERRIIGGVTAHTYINFPDYKELLESCAAVHANSMLLFNDVKKINPNAYYVPNGVDHERFKYVPRTGPNFRVGYVGKDHNGKGFRNFIVPACDRARIELKAQTCKYNDLNKIDPSDMPHFYHNIDCVAIASNMDGTPNQLLEAAATGRTFVGVRIGNIPEFYNEKNGFIVDRTVGALYEKIRWLKDHPTECKEMGIEARKTIEKSWTWEVQSRNYARMFEEVLNKL